LKSVIETVIKTAIEIFIRKKLLIKTVIEIQ